MTSPVLADLDEFVTDHRPHGLADLGEFVTDHRPHRTLTGDATAPEWNGYRVTVACSCGVVFEWWITPWDADRDLLMMAIRN